MSPPSPTTAKFLHRFSGISVWIEPDPSQTSLLLEEMDYLMQKCGGREAGMHMIVPHCTLLYNTSFPCGDGLLGSDLCGNSSDDCREKDAKRLQQQQGEDLLRQCLTEYCKLNQQNDVPTETAYTEIPTNNMPQIKMIPTSHYYFPYPKTADNGRGFGCAISLLILETTPELKSLQESVKKTFPPDERHGGGSDKEHESHQPQNDDGEPLQEDVEFRPHMALIYAPENHENVTNGWLEDHTVEMEEEKHFLQWTSTMGVCGSISSNFDNVNGNGMYDASKEIDKKQEKQSKHNNISWDAKYLSVWSTEGTLDEWFRIAKLDLMPAQRKSN